MMRDGDPGGKKLLLGAGGHTAERHQRRRSRREFRAVAGDHLRDPRRFDEIVGRCDDHLAPVGQHDHRQADERDADDRMRAAKLDQQLQLLNGSQRLRTR